MINTSIWAENSKATGVAGLSVNIACKPCHGGHEKGLLMGIGGYMQDPCFRVLTSRRKLHNQSVSALAYDPEGKQLVSASRDGVVIVWDEWANPIRQ